MKSLRMKWVNICLAAALMFSVLGAQIGFAAESGQQTRTSFPDVPKSHWAIKHVSKMALKEVITGYNDGSFKPSNNVSRQEAITMAIRLMGLEDEAKSSQISMVLPFEIADYAKPYVYYAFDQGLLNFQEELNILGPNRSGEQWGASPASREWIAKLTIRAIEKEEQYSGTEKFADQSEIAAWALGYVNAAVNLDIVTGRNEGFAPKDPVTRAEIATFFSRADIYLKQQPAYVALGSVRNISSTSISIQQSNGQLQQYALDSSSAIFTYAKNESIDYSAIQNFNIVYIIHQQGKAAYIEVLDDSIRTTTVTGKLTAPIKDGIVEIEVNGERFRYELNSTSLEIVDADGRGMNSAALVAHSTVELSYVEEEDSSPLVTHIKVIRIPVNKSAEGKIQQLSRTGAEIVVQEAATGKEERYSLAEELTASTAAIPYGNRTVGLDDLHTGDLVAYKVENDVVTSLELLEPQNPLLVRMEGTVTNNDVQAGVLYFKSDTDLLGKYFASKVEVELEGNRLASEKDVVPGDEVILYLNQNEQIVKISIKNRSISAKFMVPFYEYDAETQSFIVNENKRLVIYHVDEDTVFKSWNNTVIPHEQIASMLQKDQRLDIVFSTMTNKLISAKLSNEYNGTIHAVDVTNRKVTINTDQGERVTFDIPAGIILEIPNQSIVGISDFKIGDQVRASLNGSQTGIGSLQLKKKVLYKVQETNVSTRKLSLLDETGTTLELTVPYATTVKTAANTSGELKDILPGSDVFINYVGKNVSQVTIANVSYGKVTAVDSENHVLTLSDYNNRGTTKRIQYEQGTLIQVNDRVYVISDPEGGQSITVMNAIERAYWKYDAAESSVYFYRPSVNDRGNYTMHINALITQDGKTIQLSSLKDRDRVIVYLYNNTVLEIEKQS